MLITAGRAIEPYWQVGILEEHFHACVGDVVPVALQAVDGGRLGPIGRKRNADRLEYRRGYDTHRPCGRHAIRARHRLEADHRMRTEPVLAGVFFPRPYQLHGTPDDLRDGDGLRDLVICIATAKASSEERIVD